MFKYIFIIVLLLYLEKSETLTKIIFKNDSTQLFHPAKVSVDLAPGDR